LLFKNCFKKVKTLILKFPKKYYFNIFRVIEYQKPNFNNKSSTLKKLITDIFLHLKWSVIKSNHILKKMKTFQLFIISILLLSFTSCKEDAKIDSETQGLGPVISTFYFIRHAEKDRSDSENPNPKLNQEGIERAIRWERIFSEISINSVYSSDFERTKMTAAPMAVVKDLVVKTYDPAILDIDIFKYENLGANVLVVGHSNTIPNFVNKMIGKNRYTDMDDYDNSSLFIVRIIDGKATDIHLKMD